MLNLGTTKIAKLFIGTNKVKYVYQGTNKIWSGASVVSYYDGDTLIGTEEVDEGADVLHPSFSTAKTGYTLYGWTHIKGADERLETYTATGEPMTLYAIYLPNTLTVVSATLDGSNYSPAVINSNYISGGTVVGANKWYAQGHDENTTYFTLNKRQYANASIVIQKTNYESDGWSKGYYDGSQISTGWSGSVAGGSHSMKAETQNDRGSGGWAWCYVGITSLTLTNPTAWV